MIGVSRERERTTTRRLSWGRTANFFLWVILVFSLLSFFFSIHYETNNNNNRSTSRSSISHSVRPQLREHSFNRALFHKPSSQAPLVTTNHRGNNPEAHDTAFGDDKRIIHTGPNPLHN